LEAPESEIERLVVQALVTKEKFHLVLVKIPKVLVALEREKEELGHGTHKSAGLHGAMVSGSWDKVRAFFINRPELSIESMQIRAEKINFVRINPDQVTAASLGLHWVVF